MGFSPGAVVGVDRTGSAAAAERKGEDVDIDRVTARSGSWREARMHRVQNILCCCVVVGG